MGVEVAPVTRMRVLAMQLSPGSGFPSSAPDRTTLDDSPVQRSSQRSAGTASEADAILMQIGALTDASMQRQRLVRGTPEYEAALETEERLASYVWRLATARESSDDGPDRPRHVVTESHRAATTLQGEPGQ